MNGLLDVISRGFSTIPSGLLAAAILGGPTAIWLLARFTNPPIFGKRVEEVQLAFLWICGQCRSINEELLDVCYHCHLARTNDSVPVIFDTGGVEAPTVGMAVGPGITIEPLTAGSWFAADFAAGFSSPTVLAGTSRVQEKRPTPVRVIDPLVLDPLVLEPRVKVSRRASDAVGISPE